MTEAFAVLTPRNQDNVLSMAQRKVREHGRVILTLQRQAGDPPEIPAGRFEVSSVHSVTTAHQRLSAAHPGRPITIMWPSEES